MPFGDSKIRMSGADRVAKHVAQRSTLPVIPEISEDDHAVVDACRLDLRLALRTFWPDAFYRPFSEEHDKIIADLQETILRGGHNLAVLWRGGGKTTLGMCAVTWAALYGHLSFVVVVAATQPDADNAISGVRFDIEANPKINQYFPKVSRPFQALEGASQRCALQRWNKDQPVNGDQRTLILSKTGEIRLPNHGGPGSGAIILGRGLGAIRGLWRLRKDGKRQRPDFVLLDDPQTRESAQSEEQTAEREKYILGDVLNLAGHNKRMAAYMAATIIAPNDLACRFLARSDWRGRRAPLVIRWPGGGEEMVSEGPLADLWQEYRDLYEHEAPAVALEFYKNNQAELEAGAEIADSSLFAEGEVSAVQHAVHKLWEIGDFAFSAEMQNAPKIDRPDIEYVLTADNVKKAIGAMKAGELPEDRAAVVAFVDLNYHAASWGVLAASNAPCYSVVDYGWWTPGKGQPVWRERDAKRTLEIAMYNACESVVAMLLTKSYAKELKAIGIDCGGKWASTVQAAVKMIAAKTGIQVLPAKGFSSSQYREPSRRAYMRKRGYNADVRFMPDRSSMMQWDSHFWHVFTQKGWLIPVGLPGSVCLFVPGGRMTHSQFSTEAAADVFNGTRERNGKMDVIWKTTGRNEMGDVVAGAAALLSTEGVRPDAADDSPAARRKAVRDRKAVERQKKDDAKVEPEKRVLMPVVERKPVERRPARPYRPVWGLRF